MATIADAARRASTRRARRADRDPSTLDRIVLTGLNLDSGVGSVDQFEDTLGRYEAIGVTDYVVHWPRPTPPYQGDEAAFEKHLHVPPLTRQPARAPSKAD